MVHSPRTTPLLKWPGGKRSLLPEIVGLLPVSSNRYFEPFLGGAAVFFALKPQRAILSDTNADLINLYLQIRDAPTAVIRILKTYKNSEDFYYKVRAAKPRSPEKRAARLLFLTTLSFNGIHRVNLSGEFNVPYGRKIHLPPCDESRILDASRVLARAQLKSCDFEAATLGARARDLVYFDPPYTVAHSNNGFVKYNEKIFSWEDQVRLAQHARRLAERGCFILVSNADHPTVRALYKGFRQKTVHRFSRIAAASQHRRQITESLYYCADLT